MTRGRVRGPAPLQQIPVWAGLEPRPSVEPDPRHPGLEALLGGLNTEQLRAVTHEAGPLLVVAGAGTGKTQVITRRIAWLIATGRARPSEILALTFTDKAAEEMQVRVDQLVPYGYTDTAIATFHAFGDRLIREFALELGLPSDLRVLTRPESVIFLREHLFQLALECYRPLGDPTRFLAALVGLFSRCKDEDISPEAYGRYAAMLAQEAAAAVQVAEDPDATALVEEAARHVELAGAFGRYQELLGGVGLVDFGDQVTLALRLLRQSPAARREVAGRFRYILVDEFQDTNRAQSELIALLAEGHRNVTVVGDDDQSIYRFRGAAISNILEFRDRYPGARTVVLRRNYRSLAPILDAARRLVRFNDPDRLEVRAGISKALRSERTATRPAPVRYESFATGGQEADWIAAEIGRRIVGGRRPRDQAVLVRANADAERILRSISAAGIPWRFSGTSGLYARPEIRLLLSFLRLMADPGSSVDLYALAASEAYGLPGSDLALVASAARRRSRSMREVLQEVDAGEPGAVRLTEPSRLMVRRLLSDLDAGEDLARSRSAGELLLAFLRRSGTLARLAATETAAAEEALGNIARFFEIVRGQSALLPDDRVAFLAPHLATLVEAGDDPATVDLDPDADAVAVLTVHKAKGLEFSVVFLPGLVAGRFPMASRREAMPLPVALVDEVLPEGDFRLQEERRLFYVAMTRARDELILSNAVDYGGARARRVSPFVLEALDRPVADPSPALSPARISAVERLGGVEEPVAPVAPPRVPAARSLVLSYSAIDAYLTCPMRYKFAHVIGVPVAPHHALTYGSALHRAVQEFHRRQMKGQAMTEDELLEVFGGAWSNEGFLSREHELARLEAGRSTLRRFHHAQQASDAVVPTYVEREFDFRLGGDRIRGRWDRVDILAVGGDPRGRGVAAGSARGAGSGPSDDVTESAAILPTHGPDVATPTLDLLGREIVVVTDYKSGDVRDPALARQRARDSLQLQIYAMAYEAMAGRLPDAVQLHFLDSGLVGRVDVDPRRQARGRARIESAADGIRAGEFRATPAPLACSWCPYRQICPSSVAP